MLINLRGVQESPMILYKYRGFASLEFALDIFVHQRLYAANFQSLNDPMEGRFIYQKADLNHDQITEIRGEKARYNILSLSTTPFNMLMWSYYAHIVTHKSIKLDF